MGVWGVGKLRCSQKSVPFGSQDLLTPAHFCSCCLVWPLPLSPPERATPGAFLALSALWASHCHHLQYLRSWRGAGEGLSAHPLRQVSLAQRKGAALSLDLKFFLLHPVLSSGPFLPVTVLLPVVGCPSRWPFMAVKPQPSWAERDPQASWRLCFAHPSGSGYWSQDLELWGPGLWLSRPHLRVASPSLSGGLRVTSRVVTCARRDCRALGQLLGHLCSQNLSRRTCSCRVRIRHEFWSQFPVCPCHSRDLEQVSCPFESPSPQMGSGGVTVTAALRHPAA